jgi:hypothetical protein
VADEHPAIPQSALSCIFRSMAAKKTSSTKKKPSLNKSAFVRSLPASISGAEVVKRAKAEGLNISVNYVYSIRARSHAGKTRAASAPASSAPAKRGPGRPPKSAAATNSHGAATVGSRSAGGLEATIEAIVERKVNELLKARLGALFG